MKNTTLNNITRKMLKHLLEKCTNSQQLLFKRMYSHDNLELNINEVVDNMDDDKLEWAFTQVEKTLNKK